MEIDELMGVIEQEVEAREACEGVKTQTLIKTNANPTCHNSIAGIFVHREPAYTVLIGKGNIIQPHVTRSRL